MSLETKIQTIHVPEVYLPIPEINYNKWAVVACDQFTSQPDYWEKLRAYVGDEPSTYHLILPEVYLEDMSDKTIQKINDTMVEYVENKLFKSVGHAFVLVERTTILSKKRLGLILTVDLDQYDYEPGKKTMIRATEKTIIERIPPRVRIRENALFELSHVMLLADDPNQKIIETLYQNKDKYPLLYDFELNMQGGHLRGYKISDTEPIIQKFHKLVRNPKNPLMFVAGDGNHSLATAKAHWERIKKDLTHDEKQNHPARYALVEIVNIYDEGLNFEGIHRLLFNVDDDFLIGLFHAVDKEDETWIYKNDTEKIPFYIPKNTPRAYEQIQNYIDEYMERHPKVTIDYIHGDQELIDICKKHPKSIGIKMPCIERSSLFPFIEKGNVLPRKSFSMGCATAKRYYLESHFIQNIDPLKGETK